MPVLSLHNLGQSFGDFDVFANLTANIHHDERVGLVGPNGIGKTTLLLILAGLSQPSSGSIALSKGTRLGYLPQEAIDAFEDGRRTVFDEMLTVFSALRVMEDRLREMEAQMADKTAKPPDRSAALLHSYGELQEAFEKRGGYEYEDEIARVLRGLGFEAAQWTTPIDHLSGGQKTRVLLARFLLEKPDLLLMDEPTNHLDVEAVQWLEEALRRWEGAILVVSHDRWFLDRISGTIWEMSRDGIETYKGNYSTYAEQREVRGDHRQEVFDTEVERLLAELDYVKRNIVRASSNARAVGRLRRLSRQIIAIEQLGVMAVKNSKWSELDVDHVKVLGVQEAEQRLKALKGPARPVHRLSVRLKPAGRSGEMVLRAHQLRVGYPNAELFTIGDLQLTRREVAALIGPNGSGKTTFLRTILGMLPPLAGELRQGSSLKLGYFAQARDDLNNDNQVIDEILRHREMPLSQARSYLAQYLFRQDDVFKPVSALSGGERGRLALAILALDEVNFLLLDEPTNHLDIPAQEVLQEVLEHFDGTVLLVSHDRYLIDRLATQIWEIREGRLEIFEGSYQQYLAAHGATVDAMSLVAARQRQTLSANGGKASREQRSRRNEHRIAQLEAQIASMEVALSGLGRDMQVAGQGGRGYDRLRDLSHQYQTTQRQLDGLIAEWAALSGE